MPASRRLRVLALTLAPLTGITSLAALGATGAAASEPESAEIALVWQSAALSTVPFSPAQSLYLAFTSKAVDRAVTHSLKRANSSEAAAVAQAAHDVLVHYFEGSSSALHAKLTESLAGVPDGAAEDRGRAIGAEAAAEQIASRAGDGTGDTSVVYSAEPGIGVWMPDSRGMAVPWYGFVDRIAGGEPVKLDGPEPVGTVAYRAELAEVQAVGREGADADKAALARYFNVPGFGLYRNGLIAHLRAQPLSLAETTDLFADLDIASAEAMRQAWEIKFDVGYWRPTAAITSDDGDPLTDPVPGWTSVLPLPPYSDYVSGHGTLTSAFAGVVRCHLGDIPLTITGNTGVPRTYGTLTAMEHDALLSRIYGGIHFRTAMEDAYLLGHTVADQVCD